MLDHMESTLTMNLWKNPLEGQKQQDNGDFEEIAPFCPEQ